MRRAVPARWTYACHRAHPVRVAGRRGRHGVGPASVRASGLVPWGPGPSRPGHARDHRRGRCRRGSSCAARVVPAVRSRLRCRRPRLPSTSRRQRWCCCLPRPPGLARRSRGLGRADAVAGTVPPRARVRGRHCPVRRRSSVLHHLSRCRPFRATRWIRACGHAVRRPGAARRSNHGFPQVRPRAGNVVGLGADPRSPFDVQNRSLVNGIRQPPVTKESSARARPQSRGPPPARPGA